MWFAELERVMGIVALQSPTTPDNSETGHLSAHRCGRMLPIIARYCRPLSHQCPMLGAPPMQLARSRHRRRELASASIPRCHLLSVPVCHRLSSSSHSSPVAFPPANASGLYPLSAGTAGSGCSCLQDSSQRPRSASASTRTIPAPPRRRGAFALLQRQYVDLELSPRGRAAYKESDPLSMPAGGRRHGARAGMDRRVPPCWRFAP